MGAFVSDRSESPVARGVNLKVRWVAGTRSRSWRGGVTRPNVTGRSGSPNSPGGVTAAAMATEVMLPAAARSSDETGGGVIGDIAKLGCVEGTSRSTRDGSRDGTSGWSLFQLAAGCDACEEPAAGTTGTQRGGRAVPASAAVVGTPSGRREGSAAFLRNAPTRRGGGARPAAANADGGSGAGRVAGAGCGAGAGARAVPHEMKGDAAQVEEARPSPARAMPVESTSAGCDISCDVGRWLTTSGTRRAGIVNGASKERSSAKRAKAEKSGNGHGCEKRVSGGGETGTRPSPP